MKETWQETFEFSLGMPSEEGFYLVKLAEKSKYKLYRRYDVDFWNGEKISWRRWRSEDVLGWAEI